MNSIFNKVRPYSTFRDKSRNGFYAMVLGGTVCIFGGAGYVLVKELLSPGGSYHIIDETVAKLQNDSSVTGWLGGGQLAVYGMGDGRSRRRPAIQQSLTEDGRKQIDAVFWVEGGEKKAKVTLQTLEQEDGGWKARYLALDAPGEPTRILIQPVIKAIRNSWNPFSRFFNSK